MAAKERPRVATIYARVARREQHEDLARQVAACMAFASSARLVVVGTVEEVGGSARPRLIELLEDPRAGIVLVETRDRICRASLPLLEAALRAQGRRIVCADPGEADLDREDDLVDMVADVLTRSMGRRRARDAARQMADTTRQSPKALGDPAQ